MSIVYIQFGCDVAIGGEFASLTNWSADKHGKMIQPEEKGSWVILHLGKTDEKGVFVRSGQRRRVPITSVDYIAERDEEGTTTKRGA